MNELTKLGNKVTGKVKQKMRLSEMKQSLRNTRDVDSMLQKMEARLVTEINEVRNEMNERFHRLFLDLDASLKFQSDRLAKSLRNDVLYLDGAEFVLFSSPIGNVVVPSSEAGLVSYIGAHGPDFVEPGTRSLIASNLKEGDTAVDVGANIGVHMLTMGERVGKSGQVVAFEPTPHLAKALAYTALLSGLRQTRIVQQLVMDKPRKAKLYSFGHSPENSIFPSFDVQSEVTAIDAQACSLDSYFAPGSRVDLVKVDVEGAEPLVFRGMQRVIEDNPDLKIVMEMSPSHFLRAGTDLDAFLSEIAVAGFNIFSIDEQTGSTEPVDASQIRQFETLNVLLTRGGEARLMLD